MNKAQLIEKLAKNLGSTKVDAERNIDALVEIIQSTIKNGGSVKIVGFGRFSRGMRKRRVGVNPKTCEKLIITPRRFPKFTAHESFKKLVNGPGPTSLPFEGGEE